MILVISVGTHAADFNTIEYLQRTAYFLPQLRSRGIQRIMMVVNSPASSVEKLADLLEVPKEVELFADPEGEAGRRFGVCRGFRPDDEKLSPFIKLL